jgi:hypothetical protein
MSRRPADGEASVVVTSAAYRVSGHPQQLQHNANRDKDDSDCPEDGNGRYEPDDEQNNAENNHADTSTNSRSVFLKTR